ncbi:MAG TPA: hypothetical protein VGL82_06185, partial [Bryobacteraceae bacterium]
LAFADIVEPTPVVLPATSIYTLANTCIPQVCLTNLELTNFTDINDSLSGGNELVTADVSLIGNVFQNAGGSPGTFISPIQLNGQIDITYFSKDALSEVGTFQDQITLLNLDGSFTGLTGTHQVSAELNPNQPSTGQTTIEPVPGSHPPVFQIGSFFDVFTELSIDNGPFMPGPERVANLETTPEPAYYGAVGLLLAGILIQRAAKAKRAEA